MTVRIGQGFDVHPFDGNLQKEFWDIKLLFRSFLWRFIRNSAKPRIHVRRKPQQLQNAHV